MRIAFISYEYPPDTAVGGIATYVYQAANMMQSRGHKVEVFAGSSYRNESETIDNVVTHRIKSDRTEFARLAGTVFADRHRQINFDVLEGPELGAEARFAISKVPEIPLVIKLHTPIFLVNQINYIKPTLASQIKWYLGALRRLKIPQPFPDSKFDKYDKETDIEYLHILDADEIASPSNAIASALVKTWDLEKNKISLVPLPYIPSQDLLNISTNTQTSIVSFIGRLESRKGVLDLAEAIPIVLKSNPDTKFRFVGASWPSPQPKVDMQTYLQRKLKRYINCLEFTGHVSSNLLPSILSNTDICVFPSIWESFGLVCAEAMAAGRGIVASNSGGMAELLDQGKVGRLISPHQPNEIASAILELLNDPTLRMELGKAARDRVLSEYNLDKIGSLQETGYLRAIERRKDLGARSVND